MKVTILGAAGGIGQSLSLLLKTQLPIDATLSLYDIAPMTLGIAIDLSHIPTSVKVEGYTSKNGLSQALKDTDIVVITAGLARKPGMNRIDLFSINADIIKNLVQQIAITAPCALIGIVTNPVNAMVVIAAEILKQYGVYNKKHLFGVSTLDIIRASTFVAEMTGECAENIEVPVVGGHSSSTILPLLSKVKNISFSDAQVINLTKRIQYAGTEVLEAKAGVGTATLSMSYAATRFILSLIRAINGASDVIEYSYVEGDGRYASFFSQPLLLGKNGIEKYLPIEPLSDLEEKILNNMLHDLEKDIALGKEFIRKHL